MLGSICSLVWSFQNHYPNIWFFFSLKSREMTEIHSFLFFSIPSEIIWTVLGFSVLICFLGFRSLIYIKSISFAGCLKWLSVLFSTLLFWSLLSGFCVGFSIYMFFLPFYCPRIFSTLSLYCGMRFRTIDNRFWEFYWSEIFVSLHELNHTKVQFFLECVINYRHGLLLWLSL